MHTPSVTCIATAQDEAAASGPSATSATPMPRGQLTTRSPIAVESSRSANQSAAILVRSTFTITAPMPLTSLPANTAS